jgi:hypothetical protein
MPASPAQLPEHGPLVRTCTEFGTLPRHSRAIFPSNPADSQRQPPVPVGFDCVGQHVVCDLAQLDQRSSSEPRRSDSRPGATRWRPGSSARSRAYASRTGSFDNRSLHRDATVHRQVLVRSPAAAGPHRLCTAGPSSPPPSAPAAVVGARDLRLRNRRRDDGKAGTAMASICHEVTPPALGFLRCLTALIAVTDG